jgi:phosphoglycerate-specific signal transduction histidine kinase
MDAQSKDNPEQDRTQAAAQVESAHQILKTLQEKIGKHPELGAAITKLEMALNILAVKTGGIL